MSVKANVLENYGLEDFQKKISEFEGLLVQNGIPRRKTSAKVWEDFQKLGPKQAEVLNNLQLSIDTLTYAAENGAAMASDKQLTWHALKFLNLVPPNNLFNLIKDEDFVEIYNCDGIQIFRNLEFYKIISYSLAEITLYTWNELFNREQKINEKIVEQGFLKGFSGVQEPYSLEIPKHHVEEKFSSEKLKYTVKFGILSPLFDASKNVAAILATASIKRQKAA